MATSRRQSVPESTPQAPQSTPSTLGGAPGGGDYTAFIWQQLSDIQGKLGALHQAMESQASAIDKLDQKATATDTKIQAINVKLAVAAAVFAIAIGVGGWVLKEVWDFAKPVLIQKLTAAPAKVETPAQSGK